jgi:hypothetical protein
VTSRSAGSSAPPSPQQKAALAAFCFLGMSSWFVYILESEVNGSFYKGYSEDVAVRLDEHNRGKTAYTAPLRPWKLTQIAQNTPLMFWQILEVVENRRYLLL